MPSRHRKFNHDHFAPLLVRMTVRATVSAPREHAVGLPELVNGDAVDDGRLRADPELELASGSSAEFMIETSSVERLAVTNGGTASNKSGDGEPSPDRRSQTVGGQLRLSRSSAVWCRAEAR